MAAPKFLQQVSGQIKEKTASVTSTADAVVAMDGTGHLDPSVMPTGIGPDIATAVASEALSAGAFVNVYNVAGVVTVRNADNTAANAGKEATGFVLASVLNAGTASVYLSGLNTAVTGQTAGLVYLGAAGAASATAPTTSGYTVQRIGTAVSATAIQFAPLTPVILA